ncbi:MAG: prephenate dehydratase domain-containing protein [Oscillospiraceae bacterium]|nr:prephenate dehydratase domain-containing protein [Oscillospiraceae bacterium]
MSELDELRRKIDEVDGEITRLFVLRMDITRQVGEYKLRHGLPVLDTERERQVLAGKAAHRKDAAQKTEITDLFEAIMAISRRQQRRLIARSGQGPKVCVPKRPRMPVENPRVIYQGEPGAYGEEATVLFFGETIHRDRRADFEGVCQAIVRGEADYGVLPIENSSTGAITVVYDLLANYGCFIAGEQLVRVSHCLMAPQGASLAGITDIYSHEQGFFQSKIFLGGHSDWRLHPVLNTAAAAKYVSQQNDRTKAAIGSKRAASLYGLSILQEKINFSDRNDTRFVIVSPQPERRPGSNKISAVFTVTHETGSLHRMLSIFAANGLNIMKLESRPIPGKN